MFRTFVITHVFRIQNTTTENCWGQNRLRRNQRQKTSRENLLFHKMRKKSKKNGKNYQRSNGQLVEMDELDQPWDSARPFAELDRPRDSAWPFAELDQSSSTNGRAGSNIIRLHLVLVAPIKLALVSSRSEVPLELYDLKTARTRFLEKHSY